MKRHLKIIIFSVCAIVFIALACGVVFISLNKIPKKYYGTYTRYMYSDGEESRVTYKISALSIKEIREEGEETNRESAAVESRNIKYWKKGEDVIIRYGTGKSYLIIDEDCLYIETSKDISLSKEYGMFFWNVKSDKADIYEIENKSKRVTNLIRETMKTWAQELFYNLATEQVTDDLRFYMTRSEEESDKTDLNTYEIDFDVPSGSISLSYDRETKKLKSIFYSSSVTKFGANGEEFILENFLDTRAILLSCMYVLGNQKNIELNQDAENKTETAYRKTVMTEYDELFDNEKVEDEYNTEYTLDNNKYHISYHANSLIYVEMFYLSLN